MKTALYLGTFDPIHVYHEAIINHLLEHCGIERVIVMVSPQSPHKNNSTLFEYRVIMATTALEKYGKRVEVSTLEEDLPKPSYTINTLRELGKIYHDELSIVMGFDNWINIKSWKSYKEILIEYPILVIPRGEHSDKWDFISHIFSLQGLRVNKETRLIEDIPLNKISSSYIRSEIKQGFNVSPYLNESVYKFIKSKKLYDINS